MSWINRERQENTRIRSQEHQVQNQNTNEYQDYFFRPGQSTISRTLAPNLTATNNTIQIINLSNKKLTDAEQRNAIKTLANNDSIIIKEADKEGAVVIMDKENYRKIVETMLSDTEHYEELRTDPPKTDKIKYSKFLKKYRDLLTEKEFDYLTNSEMKLSNFYGLPKVHKSTKN